MQVTATPMSIANRLMTGELSIGDLPEVIGEGLEDLGNDLTALLNDMSDSLTDIYNSIIDIPGMLTDYIVSNAFEFTSDVWHAIEDNVITATVEFANGITDYLKEDDE